MPQTVSGTLLGTFKSIARAAMVCNAGITSVDVLTVAHQLGVCPDIMTPHLRSAVTVGQSTIPLATLALRSWNASQVIFDAPAFAAGANQSQFDIICELTWAPAR